MEIVVFTNDKHLWLLPGFQYLFNKYWGSDQSVTVAGYAPPKFKLEKNFKFESIDKKNYPSQQWSDGLIKFLQRQSYEFFVLLLEDYWIYSHVDRTTVDFLYDHIQGYIAKDVVRIDLSADRASALQKTVVATLGDLTVIETPPRSKYQMSFQAAIWNRELLLENLRKGDDPWLAEVDGSKRLSERVDRRVLGTLNYPVKYQPVWRSHSKTLSISKLSLEDQQELAAKGWI